MINNPTENDYTLVRLPNKDYIRQLIWTREYGRECGTEHIQAYVKLQRQQRMSFIKKLFPRGNFRSITKDDYDLNTQTYTQKEDDTTGGAHHNTINDPIPSVDSVLKQIGDRLQEENYATCSDLHGEATTIADDYDSWADFMDNNPSIIAKFIKQCETDLVLENPRTAKLLVSPTYSKLKKEWFTQIFLSRFITKDADEHTLQGQEDPDDVQAVTLECADHQEASDEEASSDGEGDTSSEGSGSEDD